MSNEVYPRILILSNECFSESSSNGRTLSMFFWGWPKNTIAQFYIHGNPNFLLCDNYFSVSDKEALLAFRTKKSIGKHILADNNFETNCYSSDIMEFASLKINKRTPFTLLCRELVWRSQKWKGKEFTSWLQSFNPQVILLQAGDFPFMYLLAREISHERNIPLILYNSEEYYFKNYNYLPNSGLSGMLYPTFRYLLRKEVKKTIKSAANSIYSCDLLKKLYDAEFQKPSKVLYTSSFIKNDEIVNRNSKLIQISYLGNLGVGRHESLIDIAEALQCINPKYFLHVYGRIPNKKIENKIKSCKGIIYKGIVNYSDVISIIHESTLLVYTESFSDFYRRDLRCAFSTKIADSLASGTCLFVYAPDTQAGTQYLLNNRCASVVTNKKELEKKLYEILENPELRREYIKNANSLANINHDIKKNADVFYNIIKNSILS